MTVRIYLYLYLSKEKRGVVYEEKILYQLRLAKSCSRRSLRRSIRLKRDNPNNLGDYLSITFKLFIRQDEESEKMAGKRVMYRYYYIYHY